MSTKRLLDRVTVTLPPDLVTAADSIARAEGRSRSWVVAEALREYAGNRSARTRAVREAAAPSYEVQRQFEEASRVRLEADLALTPAERVHVVEDLARFAIAAHPRPRFERITAFDSWDDYFAWKKTDFLLP